MANEYLKPQIPLKDLNSENYFYPLTTIDQILLQDNSTRLNSLIDKSDFIASRAIYYDGIKLLSSENIFLNDSQIAINKTSITEGYNFEVNGNSLFNNNIQVNGKILMMNSADSVFLGAFAEQQLNKTDIRTWCDTATNIHKSSYQGDMVLKRFFSQDETAATYNLPCVDSHMLIFSIDGSSSINWTRILALDMRSPTLFIGGKNSTTWQSWTQLITDNTAQTITNEKTFTTDIVFNTNTDLGIIQSYYNGTKYNILRHHNNGNISLSAESGDLYLGYTNTGIVHTTKTLKIDGGMNWPAPQNIICSYTANNQECSFDLTPGSYTGCYWHIWSGTNSASILQCFNDNRHVVIPVHLAVGGYNNTSYGLSCNSFICNSWVRTKGSAGWYSEDHGGGWYMSDNTWLRSYNSKAVYTASGIIRSDNAVWGNSVVINSNWVGFYNGVQGNTRYGYVQANANRMYFRKENGVSTYHFDFNGHLYSTGQFVTAGDRSFRIIHNNRGAFWHWNANSGQQWFYLMFTAANDGFGGWTGIRAFYANADTGYTYHTRAYSAVWNDYAEFRQGDTIEPGRVVIEQKNGIMTMAQKRLAPGAKIISDTYGFAIGETKKCKTPIAVTGRVLVYPFRDKNEYELGAAVCAAPGGTVDIMTREEIREYPERIIGTVSEIPTYDIWHAGGSVEQGPAEEIKVNGRIWVYVR